jgi:hypothetical protein
MSPGIGAGEVDRAGGGSPSAADRDDPPVLDLDRRPLDGAPPRPSTQPRVPERAAGSSAIPGGGRPAPRDARAARPSPGTQAADLRRPQSAGTAARQVVDPDRTDPDADQPLDRRPDRPEHPA